MHSHRSGKPWPAKLMIKAAAAIMVPIISIFALTLLTADRNKSRGIAGPAYSLGRGGQTLNEDGTPAYRLRSDRLSRPAYALPDRK